ncbi:MAG: type III-B CRISPR module-associated protein Cmr5 [Treponema sp.]|jgi:CRISPR-associated protein Cmr5|nr:type III-B CRISPR module-associated protein Cmr5 [Treponema sp.]
MQTKQQQRAQFALENIGSSGTVDKETANFIVGTPTMILTNGIGQTLAFLLSKKDKDKKRGKEKMVFELIKKWLCKTMNTEFGTPPSDIDFIRKFNGLSQQKYLEAQHETLKLLEWLKRYARAFQEEK